MVKVIGIDTGGTLTKVAYVNNQDELTYISFPSNDLEAVRDWIETHPEIEEIGVTGGRTEQLRDVLRTMKKVHYIVEFEATLKGVRHILKKEGHKMKESIITNIGTGTSIHYTDGITDVRVGGTGIGGGTLVGLAALTTGIMDFATICELAKQGKREDIDLLVRDIYQGMDTPIDGHLTASNFGKLGITEVVAHEKSDILATVQGLIGEVIATMSVQYANEKHTNYIVYTGSTLSDNTQLRYVLEHYTLLKKFTPVFINDHGFAGAVGAFLNVTENDMT